MSAVRSVTWIGMGLFSLFLAISPGYAKDEKMDFNGLESAMNQGTIGEISTLYLKYPGFSFHPMTNDFMGNTDKLMTASSNLSFLFLGQSKPGSYHSMATNLYWRALTPSFRPKDGAEEFPEPIGVFADWLELQTAYALTKDIYVGGVKLQLAGGYGDINNKHGIKKAHYWIHQKIGQPTADLSYDDQPEGKTYHGNAMAGYILPVLRLGGFAFSGQGAVGVSHSKSMYEYYYQGNIVLALTENLRLGAERKIAHQLGSELYDKIEPIRFETSYSILFFKCYQPSVKYVSAYLVGDPVGQMYVDLVNLSVPF